MEEWQKEHMKTNRAKLLEVTTCNELLLHQLSLGGVLADVDLEAIRCRSTSSDKVYTLYEILETRKDGYVAVIKALEECKQTGAYEILIQGYAYCLSLKTPVHFLGITKPLGGYFEEEEIKELITDARKKLLEKQHMNINDMIYSSSEEGITLLSNVEPPSTSLYIPRKLFQRIVIHKRLFHVNSPDIFVFDSFQALSQLNTLVYPQKASLSSAQLAKGKLTSRFILLEKGDDWEGILKITCVPTHLLKHEEETKTCVLEASTGGSEVINGHLARRGHDSTGDGSISEQNFIDDILKNSEVVTSPPGVCICDSPGMGKTLLLAKIACKIAERCPDRLVAFISLSQFFQHLAKRGIPPQVDDSYTRNCILEYVSTSPLSFCVLDRILEKHQIPMELFFDGFDEINFKHVSFAKRLLKQFTTVFPNTRVYVTSRPHVRHALEESLGVIAFDIMPFTEADQIEFLVSFWKMESNILGENEKRFEIFAQYCLESLSSNKLTKEEQNITGVPLLCRLLAQVYSRNAKRFSRATKNELSEDDTEAFCQFESRLPNLYANYVKGSFKKLGNKTEFIVEVKQYHIWMAVKTLFPEFEADFSHQFPVAATQEVFDSSLSLGILEKRFIPSGETVEFVHRTFAEYFVSEFFADALKNLHHNESVDYTKEFKLKVSRFLLETVMMTRNIGEMDDFEGNIFINSVVIYFLNFFMEEFSPFSFQDHLILAQHFPVSVSPNHLYGMLFGCFRENYNNIFHLLQSILFVVEEGTRKRYKSELIPDGETHFMVRLINVASVFSSLSLVAALFALFKECFGYNLQLVCEEMPLHLDTPLHFAIERADVEKIQYFAKIISIKGRRLLLSSVIKTNEESQQIVQRKISMCRLLLSLSKDLLLEATYTLYDSVHVEILKALFQEGADPAEVKAGETVVHRAATYMNSGDFHELCRFLIKDCKADYLFKPNERKWTSPLPSILHEQKNVQATTLEMILDVPGVNVNERDKQENTLFLIAVKEGHNTEILDLVVNSGADINASNVNQQNGLHLAASTKHAPLVHVRVLLNLGIDPRQQDFKGNTFLHLMADEESTAEEYLEIVNVLVAKGQTDLFHIRNKNGRLPVHMAVENLEVKEETLHLFKSHHVDFNSTDNEGMSLLMCAVNGRRSLHFLKFLVDDMGVDVWKRNKKGETFTHLISKYYSTEQYHELVTFLIDKGFENLFTTADNDGSNPLHWVAIHKELLPETLELFHKKLFVKKDTKPEIINITDNGGMSFIMHAAENKRSLSLLKSLLDMGADIKIQDTSGRTLAHLVASNYSTQQHYEMMKLLIQRGHGEVYKIANNLGTTPLHWAVGYLDSSPATWHLVKTKLVDTGLVDINITDVDGHSILMYASIMDRSYGYISTDTPITLVRWGENETNFMVYRSLEKGWTNGVPKAEKSAEPLKILMEMGAQASLQNKDGDTLLHYIAYIYSPEEYHDMAQFMISNGHQNVFAIVNKDGRTPIHHAISENELLETTLHLFNSTLFQTGIVDINAVDTEGVSILMFAAIGKRSLRTLQILIDFGADIYSENKSGENIAHYIAFYYAEEEYHEIVKMLINGGQQKVFAVENKTGQTPIHFAVLALELLQATLDLFNVALFQTNIVDINSTDKEGQTILMRAVGGKRSVNFLQILIEMGADLYIQDKNGHTFAHYIASNYSAEEYHEILKYLISKGHQKLFSVVAKAGQTPFHNAFYKLELLEATLNLAKSAFFETKIVDINAADLEGNCILMRAVSGKRSVKLLKTLIEMGADLTIQNKDGGTFTHEIPFYYKADQYHQIVQFLISRGHEQVFAVANNEGQSPLHIAVHNLELLESTLEVFNSALFRTKIVDINSTDPEGKTILMYAAAGKMNVELVKTFIDFGADVSIQTENGSNFAHIIAFHFTAEDYHEMIKFLIKRGEQNIFAAVNKAGQLPIHLAVLEMELLPSTLNLFNSSLVQTKIMDINWRDVKGQSILLYAAARRRSVGLVQALVEMGADLCIPNNTGDSFAHIIARYYDSEQYHEMVDLIAKAGQAKIFLEKNLAGQTPLHFAVYWLELLPETVELLAACFNETLGGSGQEKCMHGLNAKDQEGNSILHISLEGKRSLQFVKHLINLGADWSVTNNHNCSLAHVSASVGLFEHLKFFVELGCDVNALDKDKNDVLQCAVGDASQNIYEMVMFLLDKGADKHHRDKKMQTAYVYAIQKGITDERILNALK